MSQSGSYNKGSGSGSPVETLTSNTGGAVPPTGFNINVLGDAILLTGDGNPGTSTITFSIVDGNAGQLIIGGGGAGAIWADLTSTNNSITITPGVNSLDVEAGATIATQYDADAGSAVPAANILNIIGSGSITTSAAGNTVTIAGGGLTWTEVLGVAQAMAVNNGYIANNAGLVTLTLPAVAAIGDTIKVVGKGAGGWKIAQNAGQTVYVGSAQTTPGAGGSIDSTDDHDVFELICITANTEWSGYPDIGNPNIV